MNIERVNEGINQKIEEKDALKQKVDSLSEDLADLDSEKHALLVSRDKLQRGQHDSSFIIRAEIEALELRQELLESSLSVISSKYDAKAVAINEFKGDEKEGH